MESSAGRPLKATVIGAGNVAWGLSRALHDSGMVEIIRVVARHDDSAAALAKALGPEVESTTELGRAAVGADIVIVAATDSAISSIAAEAGKNDAIWVHTSGSVDASVLAPTSSRYGVLYPMQTFTRGVAVDLADSPIFIEASDSEVHDILEAIARKISSRVADADSEGRRRLHCAAVFACNFTNHMWLIADRIAREAGATIADYFPLIEETLRKAREVGPRDGQTGPARRGARAVTDAHLALLDGKPREIYSLLTASIASEYEQD